MFYLPSFIGGWPVFPAPFAKVIVFSPLHILASFVKDKVFIGVWIYLWAFYLFLFVSICSIDLYFCLCASTILSGILNSWHLPEGWQPEISSPEETQHTWDDALEAHPGNWTAGTREVIKMHVPPRTVCSPSTWSPEPLRPGKGTKLMPNWVCALAECPRTWTWAA